ncbi:hypothetical protein GCM10009605_34330 [Nocardiopsis composta]
MRLDFSDRATALGTYPTRSAAAITRIRVSSRTGCPLKTRDTDAIDTPASSAMVMTVGLLRATPPPP